MEKEWEIKTFSDFVWTEVLWLLFFVGTGVFCVWVFVTDKHFAFLAFGIYMIYGLIRKAILLFRTVPYRRKNPVYFKISGQILHYSLPETGQGQIDVRQLDLLQHRMDNHALIIPLRDGSGSLKWVRQHFQAPFVHQDYCDWCQNVLADLEKVQWDNQQPFHSFLNKEIQS